MEREADLLGHRLLGRLSVGSAVAAMLLAATSLPAHAQQTPPPAAPTAAPTPPATTPPQAPPQAPPAPAAAPAAKPVKDVVDLEITHNVAAQARARPG